MVWLCFLFICNSIFETCYSTRKALLGGWEWHYHQGIKHITKLCHPGMFSVTLTGFIKQSPTVSLWNDQLFLCQTSSLEIDFLPSAGRALSCSVPGRTRSPSLVDVLWGPKQDGIHRPQVPLTAWLKAFWICSSKPLWFTGCAIKTVFFLFIFPLVYLPINSSGEKSSLYLLANLEAKVI